MRPIEIKDKMSWITKDENELVFIEDYLQQKIATMEDLTVLQKQEVLKQCLGEIYGKRITS